LRWSSSFSPSVTLKQLESSSSSLPRPSNSDT
jgi:hypothetical protein